MQYQWQDILITGDSFCISRTNPWDWPQLVCSQLTGLEYHRKRQPRGQGYGGGAWWSTRRCLLRELAQSVPRVLIICHTDPGRIPSDNDYSLTWGTVADGMNFTVRKGAIVASTLPKRVKKAANLYYQELYSEDFHNWIQQQWFLELDRIIESHDIERVIHLFCFDNYFYQFRRGVSVRDILMHHRTARESTNHFNEEVSEVLAANLVKLITDYPGDGTDYPGSII